MAPTTDDLDARLKNVEASVVNLTEADKALGDRVKVVEDRQVKLGGIIEKIGDVIVKNPKVSAALGILTAAFMTWLTARFGILPGVHPDDKPVQNPPAQVAPVDPASEKLDKLRKSVKENQ